MYRNTYSNVAQTVKMQMLVEVALGQRRVATNHLKAAEYRRSLIARGIIRPVSKVEVVSERVPSYVQTSRSRHSLGR